MKSGISALPAIYPDRRAATQPIYSQFPQQGMVCIIRGVLVSLTKKSVNRDESR